MAETTPSAPETAEIVGRFPTTTIQRQMWFIDQLAPGDPTLNVAVRWEILGPVRAASIEAALQQIIARHEILRTRFVFCNDEPMQEVVKEVPFRLGVVDLRTTPDAQHAARLDEIADSDTTRPFDLTEAGLMRATLVRLAPERAFLLVTAHHTVMDGTSIAVIGHEIGLIASAIEAGQPPDLPELPLQYGDYALWQKEYLASGVLAEDEAYWARQMKGAPYFQIAPDKPRPPQRSTAIARTGRPMPRALIARLEALAKAQGVSLFTLTAAAASGALFRVTGADEVLMSTPIAGRIESDLELLIGPFISQHILRLPTRGETAFTDHLRATHEVVTEAIAHQSLPFSRLIEVVNPPRDPSLAPLTSVAFGQLYAFHRDARYGAFEMLSAPSFAAGSAQDLQLLLVGRASGWQLTVEYCPAVFEAATAEALLSTLADTLQMLADSPETPLAALPLAPALAGHTDGAGRPFARLEEVLASHPEVAAVAAMPTDGGTGTGSYAFVSPRADSLVPLETLPAELMGFAARRLPPEALPQGISVLAGLPQTPQGDIDRARLPRPLTGAPMAALAPTPARETETAPEAPETTAAPRDAEAIEARLAALWSDLLAQPDPPRDVSFFDLGGHSLLAVRLMARLREVWGLSLGVATIYAAPTLRALAARVAGELGDAPAAPADDWRIEPIVTEGSAQPIIAVNDVALILSANAHFREARKSTCVRLFDGNRGIDGIPRDFEGIAAEYAAVIRKVQPKGPYLLFGVCVHGNIALEAARLLQAEGETIAGIVIKDVWEPGYAAAIHASRAMRWRERRFALGNKMRMVRAGTLTLSAMLGSYRLIRRTGVLQLAARLGLIDRVRATDLTAEQERFVSYISAARNRYRPAPLDAPVLHIVTSITPHRPPFAASVGWEKVVAEGQLKTVYMDGEIIVKGGREWGTKDLARELEGFVARAPHRLRG